MLFRSVGVERRGNRLVARFRHALTGVQSERETSQLVVESGTMPVTSVFDELRGLSANGGTTDNDKLLAGLPQCGTLSDGAFELHRIGDAVSSRNVHSAVYDALRLCMVL